MHYRWPPLRCAAIVVAVPVAASTGGLLVRDGASALVGPLPPGAGGLAAAVAAGAQGAAGAVLLWLALGAAVAVADVLVSQRGAAVPWLSGLAAKCTSARLRQVVAAALGAGVLCSVAVPAHASTAVPASVTVATSVVDPGWAAFTPAPPPSPPRVAPPDPGPVVGTPRAAVAVEEPVVVRRGDTLWDIAQRHLPAGASAAEIAVEWPRWYAANRAVIGTDPDLLVPGTVLVAPGTGS